MSKYIFTIVGGIGDILLGFSGINNLLKQFKEEELKCICASHYKDAEILLKNFNFEKQFYNYSNSFEFQDVILPKLEALSNYENYLGDVNIFNTTIYPDIEINENDKYKAEKIIMNYEKLFEQNDNKVHLVGIHPFGSKFSNDYLTSVRRVPNKYIEPRMVAYLIKEIRKIRKNVVFAIFGSKEEEFFYDFIKEALPEKSTIPVFNNNIWKSLAFVDFCHMMICADSAIKTYSCIKKIPTIVLLGDYEDRVRDSKFIKPYEKDNIMKVIKFKSEIKNYIMDSVKDETIKILGKTLY